MSRLDIVIQQVKQLRQMDVKYRQWIIGDDGNIKPDVLCGDVLPLLEELREYEINVSDKWITNFKKNSKGMNTYNWGANISNDLNIDYRDNCGIALIMVHLAGDIRGGYSGYFAVKLDYMDDLFCLESTIQHKDIDSRYTADICLFHEGYSVYDNETQTEVGDFYELETKDWLRNMNEVSA